MTRPDLLEIHRASQGLTAPGVHRRFFGDELLDRCDLLRWLRGCVDDEAARERVRVYIDGSPRPELGARLLESLPSSDQPLDEWLTRQFADGQRFGLIVDRPPLADDELAARLGGLLAPLIGAHGLPQGGFEPHLFVGNYGYTPFGIHRDTEQGAVLHLHLGPGSKRMTLWSAERYAELTGAHAFSFEPEPLIPAGESFEIGAGDLFVLPTRYFHVGHTPELSAALALAVVDLDAGQLLDELFRLLGDEARSDAATLMAPRIEVAAPSKLGSVVELMCETLGRRSLDLAVSEAARDRQALLASNLGLIPAAPLRVAEATPLEAAAVQRCGVFPLLTRSGLDDTLNIYVRGHKLELGYDAGLERLIDTLAQGRRCSVAALISSLQGEWDEQAVRYVLGLLWQHRGIDVA